MYYSQTASQPRAETSQSSAVPEHTPRILLARQGFIGRKLAAHRLRKQGYTVDIVTTGEDVMRALHANDYDVLLMDVEFPDVNGIMAAKHIRACWREKAPRIVGRSRSPFPADHKKIADESGMDVCVSRHTRDQDIAGLIKHWLRVKGNVGDKGSRPAA